MLPLPDLGWPMAHGHFNDYEVCPKRFFHKYIGKDCPAEQKSWQQRSGIGVHKAIRDRLKRNEPLPAEFSQYEAVCATIFNDKRVKYVEHDLGCTISGKPCGFWDTDCRIRTRIDLCLSESPTAFLLDWKTGKPWEDPAELALGALLLRINFPDLTNIVARFFWLRTSQLGMPHVVNDVAKTWEKLHDRMAAIKTRIANNDWPSDEGPLCGWCPVSKAQCHHKREPK